MKTLKVRKQSIICPSGVRGTVMNLQRIYKDKEEFEYFDEMYGICKRLGYSDRDDCWQINPVVQSSTNPSDYCRLTASDLKKLGIKYNVVSI